MATTYDKASLVMIPSGYKDDKLYSVKPTDGSGDFTFSRDGAGASPATRVNASGLIEKGRENLLPYSNTFNTGWSPVSGTLAQGVADPFGGNDAWSITATNTDPYLYNQTAWSGVATLSIWAKGVGSSIGRKIQLRLGGSFIEYTLTSEWQRFEHFVSGSAANIGIEVPNPAVAGDVVHIYGAQLEYGLVATDYIETTTAPVSAGLLGDMPRLDYSGGATCPSLLLEPSRVNLILHSEYTDGTNWSNEGSIVDEENTSETTSPEGVYNAVKLVSANATSEQWIQASGVSVTSGSDCTLSCFVKKSDYDYFHIRFTGVGGAFAAGSIWFNIANGTLGTAQSGITGTIEDYGNGWYRISATKEVTATAFAAVRFQLASSDNTNAVVGDGSKGTYVYGFQAEQGSYPTSYIPTYGSASTRGADEATRSGISSLIGQTEGTLYFEGRPLVAGTYTGFTLSDGTTNNEVLIRFTTEDRIEYYLRSNGTQPIGGGTTAFDTDVNVKIAFAYKGGDSAVYVNGSLVTSNTTTDMPLNLNTLRFARGSGTSDFIGICDNINIFPTRLTNAELAALTTI